MREGSAAVRVGVRGTLAAGSCCGRTASAKTNPARCAHPRAAIAHSFQRVRASTRRSLSSRRWRWTFTQRQETGTLQLSRWAWRMAPTSTGATSSAGHLCISRRGQERRAQTRQARLRRGACATTVAPSSRRTRDLNVSSAFAARLCPLSDLVESECGLGGNGRRHW